MPSLVSLSLLALVSSLVPLVWAVPNVLFYTYTPGFRHDSIPTALDTFRMLSQKYNAFTPVFSEDPHFFTQQNLSAIDAVVFISTSEQVLTEDSQLEAFVDFLTRGGGFLGFHLAAGTLYLNPFYGNLVGSYFTYHPEFQRASFIVQDHTHRTTRSIPANWTFEEEVYNFQSDPRHSNTSVTITVDPNSYVDPNAAALVRNNETDPQGTPHPISWWREGPFDLTNGTSFTQALNFTPASNTSNFSTIATGRMYYSALGHANETWQNETFQTFANDCLEWVLNIDSTPDVGKTSSTSGSSPTQSVDVKHHGAAPVQSPLSPYYFVPSLFGFIIGLIALVI